MFVKPDNHSAEHNPFQLSASGSIAHLGYTTESDVVQFSDVCGVMADRGELMVKSPEGTLIKRLALDRPGILVGRANGCDIRLQHPEVRYRHAYLQCVDDRILVCDLGKRTRSRRARRNVVSELFNDNDVVSVGPYSIHLSRNEGIERAHSDRPSVDPMAPSGIYAGEHELPKITLDLFAGAAIPTKFDVRHDLTLIGKGSACKVRLVHRSVSKVHCSLVRTRSGLWVVDLLGRGAGTLVDGRRIKFAQLHNGSILQVGKFSARISINEAEPPTIATVNAPPLPAPQFTQLRPRISEDDTAEGHNGTSSVAHSAPTQLQTSQQFQNLTHPHEISQANGVDDHSAQQLVSMVRSMLAEFGATQTDVVERMHESTIETLHVITALQSNQIEALREEVQRVHEINAELLALQKQSWQTLELAIQHQPAIEHPHAEEFTALLETGRELSQRMETLPSQIASAVAATAPTEQKITVSHPDRIAQAAPAEKISEARALITEALEIQPVETPQDLEPPAKVDVDEQTAPARVEQLPAENAADESDSAERVPSIPTSQVKVEQGHAWVCGRIATLQKERDSRWGKIKRLFGGG